MCVGLNFSLSLSMLESVLALFQKGRITHLKFNPRAQGNGKDKGRDS